MGQRWRYAGYQERLPAWPIPAFLFFAALIVTKTQKPGFQSVKNESPEAVYFQRKIFAFCAEIHPESPLDYGM